MELMISLRGEREFLPCRAIFAIIIDFRQKIHEAKIIFINYGSDVSHQLQDEDSPAQRKITIIKSLSLFHII